jgi:hypothetical protein
MFPKTVESWARGSRKNTGHNPTSPISQPAQGTPVGDIFRLGRAFLSWVAAFWLSTTPKIDALLQRHPRHRPLLHHFTCM